MGTVGFRSPMGLEGSVGSSTPLPPWGPAASPGTQTPGSQGELHPVLAAGEAQPVIGMSHPLARQPGGGGGRKGKRGREERKGGELEGSLRQRLGLDWVLERDPLLHQGP